MNGGNQAMPFRTKELNDFDHAQRGVSASYFAQACQPAKWSVAGP
jgi:hypothetical protein